jgi:hypothetical protein
MIIVFVCSKLSSNGERVIIKIGGGGRGVGMWVMGWGECVRVMKELCDFTTERGRDESGRVVYRCDGVGYGGRWERG